MSEANKPSIIFVFDATVDPQVLIYRENFTGDDTAAWFRMVELSEQYGTGCQVDYVTWDFIAENSATPEQDYNTWANTNPGQSVDATWPRSAIPATGDKCGTDEPDAQPPVVSVPEPQNPVTVTVSTSGAVVRRSEATEPPSSEISPTSTSSVPVSPAAISTVQVAGIQTSRPPLAATGSDPTGLVLVAVVLIAVGAGAVKRARRIAART